MNRLTDEQRDLVEKNLDVAKYAAKRKKLGLGEEDAAQEAAIGVMDAATRYNESFGSKFSAYATRRAYGAIQDAERNSGIIRLTRLANRKSKEKDSEDLRKLRKVASFKTVGRGGDDCEETSYHTHDPAFIPNKEASTFDRVVRNEWHSRFWEEVSRMSPRHQTIIKERLAGKSLKEIGQMVGCGESGVCHVLKGLIKTLASNMQEIEVA
jgi:RNA polymerase sigma factor (sigma-70 family)